MELNIDNIASDEELSSLFSLDNSEEENNDNTQDNASDTEEKDNPTDDVENLSIEDLFGQESVSEEDNIKEKKDTVASKKQSTSPNSYSSIAKAFAEDGIFPDLDKETIENINSAESLRAAIDAQISAGLNERARRIENALNYGVPNTEVQSYERALRGLETVTDERLEDEGEDGNKVRKTLIIQDFTNRGYSREKAETMYKRSYDNGTDVEDAKEALVSVKEYITAQYNSILQNAENAQKQLIEKNKKEGENFKKSILEDKNFFGDLDIDQNTRKKIYANITSPVYKDPDTGELYTAIQKYQKENYADYIKNIGILFTLTDGFKSLDKLVGKKVRKGLNEGLKNLENTLSNTARTSDGNIKFVGNLENDSDSFFGNFKLDI